MSGIGRPFRTDIDMEQVRAMMAQYSVREIGRQLDIPCNTLFYRLRNIEIPSCCNPFCVQDRVRMCVAVRVGGRYFYCPRCGEDTRQKPPLVFCISCRARMYAYRRTSGETYFRCRLCRTSTIYRPPRIRRPRGAPLRQIDHQRASALLQQHPVLYVAEVLGVHRNVLYNHINKGLVIGRPFRTWTPRPGWIPPSRDAALAHWPYMKADDPRYSGIVKEVNEAVSREIPDAIRSDICQELVVSVLTGEVARGEIKSAVRQHLQRHYKMFPVKAYQTISLDAPIRSNRQDGQERRLIDVLDNDAYQEKISILRYGDSLSDCSSASELAQRLTDRWEANRLTQDRKTYGEFRKANGRQYSDPEYDRFRRKYKLFNSRVHAFDFPRDGFGGAWSVENAPPEETRAAGEEARY